jgi:hypothetical protein
VRFGFGDTLLQRRVLISGLDPRLKRVDVVAQRDVLGPQRLDLGRRPLRDELADCLLQRAEVISDTLIDQGDLVPALHSGVAPVHGIARLKLARLAFVCFAFAALERLRGGQRKSTGTIPKGIIHDEHSPLWASDAVSPLCALIL